MRLRRPLYATIGVLALAALFGFAPLAGQERSGADVQPPAKSYRASCVLRISAGDSLPLDEATVNALLESAGVLSAAVREVLELPATAIDEAVSVGFSRVGVGSGAAGATGERLEARPAGDALVGQVYLEIYEESGVRAAAEELLANVCARLMEAVGSLAGPERVRLERELESAKSQQARARQRLDQLRQVQQELWERAAAAELPRTDILNTISEFEKEMQSIEFELVGREARGAALTEQIAKIAQRIEQAPKDDAVATELEKVVAIREKELQYQQARNQEGVVGQGEVGAALEKLALAKAELAERRQAIAEAAGGDLLADLNTELVKLSIETAEMEARREFLRAKLAAVEEGDLLELADRYEREVTTQLPVALDTAAEATRRCDVLEYELLTFTGPTVTVVGGP